MFFLIRVAFWLSLVVLLLPTGGAQPTGQASNVGAADAIVAASAAVSDMRDFCTRQPQACTVGSQAAAAFGQKAQAGAKMLYEFLSEHVAGENPVAAGATSAAPAAKPSQNTLSPADREPAWRGPLPPRRPH